MRDRWQQALMKIKNKKIVLFTFGILFLSSFMPMIQVMLAYLNGGLIYLFEIVTTVDRNNLTIPINLLLLLISLYFYLKWNRLWKNIIAILVIIFSINGIFLITFDRLISSFQYYWLPFIIETIIISAMILSVDILRTRITPNENKHK